MEYHATNLVAADQRSTLPSTSLRIKDFADLVPVSPAEFATEMSPCLTLCGGVGMNREERRTWLNAAYKALDGIPILLLQRGAQVAMLKADHPSKIVPKIVEAIGEDWAARKRAATRTSKPAPPPQVPAIADNSMYTLAELRKIPRSMRATALKQGWCSQAQIDQLDGEISA